MGLLWADLWYFRGRVYNLKLETIYYSCSMLLIISNYSVSSNSSISKIHAFSFDFPIAIPCRSLGVNPNSGSNYFPLTPGAFTYVSLIALFSHSRIFSSKNINPLGSINIFTYSWEIWISNDSEIIGSLGYGIFLFWEQKSSSFDYCSGTNHKLNYKSIIVSQSNTIRCY